MVGQAELNNRGFESESFQPSCTLRLCMHRIRLTGWTTKISHPSRRSDQKREGGGNEARGGEGGGGEHLRKYNEKASIIKSRCTQHTISKRARGILPPAVLSLWSLIVGSCVAPTLTGPPLTRAARKHAGPCMVRTCPSHKCGCG